LRFGDPHFLENGPAGDFEELHIEAEQRVFGHFHRAAAVVLMLAQEQEVLPDLVSRERWGGRTGNARQLAHVPDVLFLGRLAEIFKLDQLLGIG